MRTTVKSIGQIEIDEIYIGLNKVGEHFIISCQAMSIGDRFGIVQVMQDLEFCQQRYADLQCRPIALQFLSVSDIAIIELTIEQEEELDRLSVVDEKHYGLVKDSE
ncbi:hypothetical protein [[Limnothrix rosea] IAM M-220]|uniref:hypothetical protein n=1 Tax=[Limnothrix rosea] IAM M-220 TaxID=454133 RepID=UPI001C0E0FFA|nr:hypothetical protein [[Limnothrix rosea] IAM M-220]